MRISVVVTMVVFGTCIAGLGISNLCAGVALMAEQSAGASAVVEHGTAMEPKQIQVPPSEGPVSQLAPEEIHRLERALEGTHLPGPKPSRGPAAPPDLGPHLVPPTSPRTPPEPDEGGSEGR